MKGNMVSQYKPGDYVIYSNGPKTPEGTGRIHKLHASTAAGTAEIKPSDGSCKVSRRLQHVRKAAR
jgi:hypothetical protein